MYHLLDYSLFHFSFIAKNVSLKSVCFHIDRELRLWSGNAEGATKIEFADYHIASVDAVKLLQVK